MLLMSWKLQLHNYHYQTLISVDRHYHAYGCGYGQGVDIPGHSHLSGPAELAPHLTVLK